MSGKVYAVPTRHRRLDIVAPMSVIRSWDGFYLIGFRGSTGRQVKHEPSIYPICQTETEAEGYLRGAAAVCGWEPWPEDVEKKSYTRAEWEALRKEKTE